MVKINQIRAALAGKSAPALLFCTLYFAIHFIPYSGAIDPMGTHWFYLALLDLVVTIYLFAGKSHYTTAIKPVFKNGFSYLYLALFALAGLSVFTALNRTEALVCYARFIVTIIAYFNIAILLHGRLHLFKLLARVLSVILLVESIQSLIAFFNGLETMPLDKLILSLQGSTGLKNIFAAALVVKIPFVIYCIYTSGLWGKIIQMGILVLGVLTIFIVNARSSYVGLSLVLLMYLAFCVLQYFKERKTEPLLYRVGAVLLPVMAAFFLSQIILSNALNLQSNHGAYGTVTERLGTISYEGDGRAVHWENTLLYLQQYPFSGCGYGNWKIASVPFAKTWANDFTVPIHSHNDFLEISAELGIQGGLLYLGLFTCLLIYSIRTWFSKADEEVKLVAAFSLMALGGYFIDACLNFPMERPIMQVFFVFIAAINVSAFNKAKETQNNSKLPTEKAGSGKPFYVLTALLFLIPATYLTYNSYQSMVAQMRILPDVRLETHAISFEEVNAAFPPVPNLTTKGQPIAAIKGTYYYYAKQYDKALALLDEGSKANPYLMYSEFMKANVFFDMNQIDSACFYAAKAFYARPRAKVYYQNLLIFCAQKNDTAAIRKAFEEYTRYRNEPDAWRLYLSGLFNTRNIDKQKLLSIADSALHLFPDNTTLSQSKQAILNSMSPAATEKPLPAVNPDVARQYLAKAVDAFNKGDYAGAARNFIKLAAINPNEYSIIENTGICYFNLKEYSKAIGFFDQVIQMNIAKDGKSEFFKAKCLLTLGKKTEGCQMLRIAGTKKHPEADAFIKQYCQ
ncbi:MAG: O-antigen ligase family protein [Sediminibacterium sp.]|nr:O-antigen ligase family protein [Sediminibacterium sp.]MDP3129517.1 O-antigen ligase family protein [Sediminibacterium sp.]